VADLVAQVPEHGPVGLVELAAGLLAMDGIGLGQVERDDPVGMAGGDRPGAAREQVEGEGAADREPELEQLEDQPPLGRLRGAPVPQPGRVAVGGPRAGQGAAAAEPTGSRDPVAADRPAVGARGARSGVDERPRVPVEAERRPAVQALGAVEGDEVPADRAREGAHPRGVWQRADLSKTLGSR
jgi:hypothetical protein